MNFFSGLFWVHYMVPFSPFPFMFLFVFVFYHVTVWMRSNKLNWTELNWTSCMCNILWLKIKPHFKRVATLPCKILTFTRQHSAAFYMDVVRSLEFISLHIYSSTESVCNALVSFIFQAQHSFFRFSYFVGTALTRRFLTPDSHERESL